MQGDDGTDGEDGVRARLIVISLLTLSAVTCRVDPGAQVEGTSGIALPGRVIWATALHPDACGRDECQATYRVRIVNTSDRDLFVRECEVLRPPIATLTTLPIAGLDGLSIPGDADRIWTASFQLAASPQEIHELAGRTLRCSGDDGLDNEAA